MMRVCLSVPLAVVAGLLSVSVSAADFASQLSGGTTSLDIRVRHETVDQDNGLNPAHANTLRHRLGYQTLPIQGWSARLETEGVVALSTQRYSSGPGGNGNAGHAVVADPVGNELNQAYLQWQDAEGEATVRVGRQRLIFDQARFIGNVGWRQNEQTFDAAYAVFKPWSTLNVQYAHLRTVNRIFFSSWAVDADLLNLSYAYSPDHAAVVYGYRLDFDSVGAPVDSLTIGLRLAGKVAFGQGAVAYAIEAARQDDVAEAAPASADYRAAELGYKRGSWGLAVGVEQLSGDAGGVFNAPLATLHKFNGWADMFLSTPAKGLRDDYLKLEYRHGAWGVLVFYHQFEAQSLAQRYGSEWDAALSWQLDKKNQLQLKFASYQARAYAVDTEKVWLQWELGL